MRCDFREERSCSCSARCEAIPAPIKAPAAIPDRRDYLALFAFAAVMSIIAFGTLYEINQQGIQIELQARI